jgi:hypothetical protein
MIIPAAAALENLPNYYGRLSPGVPPSFNFHAVLTTLVSGLKGFDEN